MSKFLIWMLEIPGGKERTEGAGKDRELSQESASRDTHEAHVCEYSVCLSVSLSLSLSLLRRFSETRKILAARARPRSALRNKLRPDRLADPRIKRGPRSPDCEIASCQSRLNQRKTPNDEIESTSDMEKKKERKKEIDLPSGDEGEWEGGRRESTTFLPERGDKITRSEFQKQPLVIATTGPFRGNVTRLVGHMTSPQTPVVNAPPTFLRDEGIDNPRARRAIRTPTEDFSSVLRRSRKWRETYYIVPSSSSSSSSTTTTTTIGKSMYPSAFRKGIALRDRRAIPLLSRARSRGGDGGPTTVETHRKI